MNNALETNSTFSRFVRDPCISRKAKGETMAKAVASADETTRKFAGVFVFPPPEMSAHTMPAQGASSQPRRISRRGIPNDRAARGQWGGGRAQHTHLRTLTPEP
jgi:hypothetical protein